MSRFFYLKCLLKLPKNLYIFSNTFKNFFIINMKYKTTVVFAILFAGFLNAQTKLSYWTFDTDIAGASFDNGNGGITNTGTIGGTWNHGKTAGMEADGLGNLVISNVASKYRKFPDGGYPKGAFNNGKYRLVIDLSAWKMDPTNSGSFAFEVCDQAGKRVVGLNIYAEKGLNTKVRFSASCLGGWQGKGVDYASYLGNLEGVEALTLEIEFDFDYNTVNYMVNGAVLKTITDFNSTSLHQLKIFTDAKWSTRAEASINEMGLIKLR